MKKLLLTLAAVLGICLGASAETYTISAAELFGNAADYVKFNAYENSCVFNGGFAFTALKNGGSTEPTYASNGEVRTYAKNTLMIQANGANITKISFTISEQGLKRLTDVTPSAGTIAEQGANPLVWNGSAASVTFTVGDKATYGTDGASKAGQFVWSTVTIDTDGPVSGFTETPTPDDPVDNTYTISADALFGNPAANAEFKTYTNNCVYNGGFAFTALKNEGTTEPTYNKNFKEVRTYAKNTLLIQANGANITSITFNISAQGLKRQAEIAATPGAIAEQGVNPLVWNGSAAAVTFTVGDKATYGTDGADKAGQFDWTSVTITTDGPVTNFTDVPGPVDPDPIEGAIYGKVSVMAAGNYAMVASGKAAKAIDETKTYGYLNVLTPQVDGDKVTVEKTAGFDFVAVDGGYNIKDCYGRYLYMTGDYNSFNVSADAGTDGYLWTVEVNAEGEFVVTNVTTKKTLQYDATYTSFGAYPDVRGTYPVFYKYEKDTEGGDVPPVEQRTSVTSLSQLGSLKNKELITMDVDLTVIYANGPYVYVYDGAAYGLVYKKDLGLSAAQVIAKGWKGAISIYSNLIEIVPDDATLAAADGGMLPSPIEIDPEEAATSLVAANQNVYVYLPGVVFEAATPAADAAKDEDGNDLRNFTGLFGEMTVSFYQRFGVESVAAGT
ncbi:MAG: hypothetical protein K2N16_09455, partial [Muribaculaceae bacterium]|nr:hypothetical protein [Muribaculaceae bacterium]